MRKEDVNSKLIKRINKGDKMAFSIFYEAYYVYLNSVAFYYLNDKEVSREIVNDTFVKVWEKRESLIYPVNSFLIKLIQNSCIDYIRAKQARERALLSHRELLTRSYEEDYIRSIPSPLEYLQLKEAEEEIKKATLQLSPRCRQIFKSYFEEGKPVEDIAKDLNISVSTVRVQIKNTSDKLKILLKHLFSLFF